MWRVAASLITVVVATMCLSEFVAQGADQTTGKALSAAAAKATRTCRTPAFPKAPTTDAGTPGWTGTWAAGQQRLTAPAFGDHTLRELVHPSLGGTALRIQIANTFGTGPLRVRTMSAGVTVSGSSPALRPGSSSPVAFHGSASVTVPPGAVISSDVVPIALRYGETLAVDLYLGDDYLLGDPRITTGHARAVQMSFIAQGDHVGERTGQPFTGRSTAWYWLAGVDVRTGRPAGSIVTLGDSLTDGSYSTMSGNHRWPDVLAARLRRDPAARGISVLNEGIGGNRVSNDNVDCTTPSGSALRRFHHDVLVQPGVRTVIIADGINDVATGVPAATVIRGLTALAAEAHARGLTVIAATITPYGCPAGCLTPAREAAREQINRWIRSTLVFDHVVDFEHAVRDPHRPDRVRPDLDLGDHLHLNDSGYAALGSAVDLATVTGSR